MAYNAEKHRNECDRCGKPIPSNQVIQLCKDCDEWLEEYCKEQEPLIYPQVEGITPIVFNETKAK